MMMTHNFGVCRSARARSLKTRARFNNARALSSLKAHNSGVCGWIFEWSTLLESCGRGQLVGAVFKARFARLEKRVSLASLDLTRILDNFSVLIHPLDTIFGST